MPKPEGFTQKGKAKYWIKKNATYAGRLYYIDEIAREVGVSKEAVRSALNELKENGWPIKHNRSGKNTRWLIQRIAR